MSIVKMPQSAGPLNVNACSSCKKDHAQVETFTDSEGWYFICPGTVGRVDIMHAPLGKHATTPAPAAAPATGVLGEVGKIDWLAIIEAKRNDASGGPYAGEWGGYWQKGIEDAGPAVGIMSTTLCSERVTPEMAEKGIDGDEWAEHELVGLLAWHEDGEELPHFAENIDYICELHNRFPLIASELRELRTTVKRQVAALATPGPAALATTGEAAAGWVSVKQHLPAPEKGYTEFSAWVLAYTADGQQVEASYYYKEDLRGWRGKTQSNLKVTHWQPLPAAPVTPAGPAAHV